MHPMDEQTAKAVVDGMQAFERFIRRERPDLPAGYFAVVRAGWLRIGVGSAALRKILVRVQGPTTAAADDSALVNPDPDYHDSSNQPRSWWRIQPASPLPQIAKDSVWLRRIDI